MLLSGVDIAMHHTMEQRKIDGNLRFACIFLSRLDDFILISVSFLLVLLFMYCSVLLWTRGLLLLSS